MKITSLMGIVAILGSIMILYGCYTIITPVPNEIQETNHDYSNITFYPKDYTILQNTLRNSSDGLLVIENKSHVLFIGNLFDGSELLIINCTNIYIHTSIFKNVDTAINIINSSDIIIEYFAIYNVSYGILIENSTDIILGGHTELTDNDEIIYNSVIKNWKIAPVILNNCERVIVTGIDAMGNKEKTQ